MKKAMVAMMALAAFAAAAGEITGGEFLLSTKNVSLAFKKTGDGKGWNLLHCGAAIGRMSDAEVLTTAFQRSSNVGQARPATYSVFGERGLTQINRYGGLAVRHADGTLSTELEAVKAETVGDAAGAVHLVLSFRDAAYPFEVVQHFRALVDCDVIETWVELRNGEPGAVRLSRMDSLALDLPQLADTYHVHHLTGQWAAEAQLVERELGRGETCAIGSRSGVRDAWEGNAGVMVSVGPRATETTGRVFGGVLCWSGLWGISVRRSQVDALSIRAGYDTAFGAYTLDAGKAIVLPKFAFTWSERGKGQVSRNIHAWARKWQMPAGTKTRPVLLNSWEGSYFSFTEKTLHDMMDGVKEMGGELFVLDDGWFGTGKYARDDVHRDRVGLGDWVINPEKLPNGLAGLAAEAKRRGLGFGFWVEPEMVNTNSWLYEAHPDWVISERTRPLNCGRGRTQTVLDYANPAVRENIYGQLDALYAKVPDLAYIKWDANADFMNTGSPYLDAEHQANFPFDYTVGLYDLLAKLRAKYPQVDIQACSSGGAHADYGFLRYADEFWGSDDSDARERVFIQWGESQFYPSQAIAAHVTACPNHQTGRTVPLKFRFDVAMSARLGFELHPKDMSAEDLAFAKRCVSDYKGLRDVIQQGDLYRLISPYGHSYAALMHVGADRSRAVVYLYGLARGNWSDLPPPVVLQGLDAARAYRIRELNRLPKSRTHSQAVDRTVSGEALMRLGLPVSLSGDYDSAVFLLEAR